MTEPEEPDQPASPAMRRVFDELEAEFEAGLRSEDDQETVAALRAGIGETVLWEQLARRFRGVVLASYPEFLVLQDGDGTEHLVRHGPATSVALPPQPATLQPVPPPAARRHRLSLALRELARRREPVRVELLDGERVDGTIEAVGADYLEVAEHHPGEARRRTAVKARRFVGFAAVVAVTLPPAPR